jgi:hypothetical protein
MTTETVRIHYGGATMTMTWAGACPGAPILLDGRATQYQTADARHSTDCAVRLVCGLAFGRVYETRAAAEDDDCDVDADGLCVWDDVAYDVMPTDADADACDHPYDCGCEAATTR